MIAVCGGRPSLRRYPDRVAPDIQLAPISADDVAEAARFLHDELNPAVSAAAWSVLLAPPWGAIGPDRGFLLRDAGGDIVGVYAAVYSNRETEAGPVTVCNLAAFCVVEEHRVQSLRLVRALLRRKDVVFTDLSPSGNVVAMNERLGFARLDADTRLTVNLPRWAQRGVSVSSDPERLQAVLTGRDAQVHRDHRDAPAAQELLVERRGRHAYLIFRADRRKGLRLFATPLYVGGDRGLLAEAWPSVAAHLLRRHGLPFTLAEKRVLGFVPPFGRQLKQPRPRMHRGTGLEADAIDYLYSELTLVSW